MDIMGTAMHSAIDDIKNIIGLRDHHSDHEENAENDDDYQNMSMLKKKYLGMKRRDSD
jgi:hypothetical protein